MTPIEIAIILIASLVMLTIACCDLVDYYPPPRILARGRRFPCFCTGHTASAAPASS